MKQRLKRWSLCVVGALAVVLAGIVVTQPAQAYGNPRLIVHVDGPKGGQVDVSGVWSDWLPEYGIAGSSYWDVDTGKFLVPNACGLRVYEAFHYVWYSNNVEISDGTIVHPDTLQGVVFTGPITTLNINATGTIAVTPPGNLCQNAAAPWYVPGPIENDDTAPPIGVDMLVLEFDPPSGLHPAFEFLDWTGEPVDVENPEFPDPEIPDPCSVPEFCEDPDDGRGPGGPPPTLDPCVLHPTRPECLPTDPPRRK